MSDESEIDTTRARVAGLYREAIGGERGTAADRATAADLLEILPHAALSGRANRAFIRRAVRHIARAGVRQLIDIGCGYLDAPPNVHDIAQQVDPGCRVHYVDNDDAVSAQDRSVAAAATGVTYTEADVSEGAALYDRPQFRSVDFNEPVGLLLNALLHFVPGPVAYDHVASLLAPLAPGSYVTITHMAPTWAPERIAVFIDAYSRTVVPVQARTREEIAAFLPGLELIGEIVPPYEWEPDEDTVRYKPEQTNFYAAVARVPVP